MTNERDTTNQRPVENDAYGNPQKTWIPTALEKPSAFPHLHTGPATHSNPTAEFKQELWTLGGLN